MFVSIGNAEQYCSLGWQCQSGGKKSFGQGGIKGVVNVEVRENVLAISTDADLRREVSKAIVQNNYPLIQMKVQEFSLDDIYMKYFREE